MNNDYYLIMNSEDYTLAIVDCREGHAVVLYTCDTPPFNVDYLTSELYGNIHAEGMEKLARRIAFRTETKREHIREHLERQVSHLIKLPGSHAFAVNIHEGRENENYSYSFIPISKEQRQARIVTSAQYDKAFTQWGTLSIPVSFNITVLGDYEPICISCDGVMMIDKSDEGDYFAGVDGVLRGIHGNFVGVSRDSLEAAIVKYLTPAEVSACNVSIATANATAEDPANATLGREQLVKLLATLKHEISDPENGVASFIAMLEKDVA